ncbi:FUSC family protein [Cupriavidus cauae]|uniref:Integral membrane bound transporter domain-containing protein n=1 Tax=Cupriavidus cauae TaxID=2608999 RepID=A0A5M8AW69_9BURK|nr:FUSC family protein [Cupriavidus cauae]KAA0182482.1 hypothetical protein FX016_06515 [Cupriavidus gilardii]KAA6128078.1 hypothetical protein F1599_07885 [Cupriavidus cauae]
MLSLGRHPQRWLLTAFLGCELAALLWLLWRARQGWAAGETAPLCWAVLAVAAVLSGGRTWRGAWRAAACRLAGVAPGGSAARIVVALPDGGQVRARVVACWQLGGVAAVLRLAPVESGQAAVPPVLVMGSGGVPDDRDSASGASRRAMLRALHASSGPL